MRLRITGGSTAFRRPTIAGEIPFGRLVRYRRRTVDRECEVVVRESMIRVAMIHLMARREPPR